MDSFELNKIAGAVLFTGTVVLGLSIVSEEIFHAPQPAQRGYEVAGVEEPGAPGAGPEEAGPSLAVLLASADPSAGQAGTRACQACHTFEQGGREAGGPNLWNVVGNIKGHSDTWNYSAAMQERRATGETWGYEELDGFLANPRGYLQGTTMNFAGVRNDETRANIIAYLASISENPPPLPSPQEPEADGAETTGDGAAAEDGGETGTAGGDAQPAENGAAESPAPGETPAEGETPPAQQPPAPQP